MMGLRCFPGWMVLAVVLACAMPRATLAQDVLYRVEAGDTLITVGAALLANPADWVKLQHLNAVADPFRIPVGRQLRIPRALLKPIPRSAQVLTVAGEAHIDGRAAAEGDRVGAGSELSTGDNGHIGIELPDGSVLVLPARSSARIDTLQGYAGTEEQSVDVQLRHGRVESRVAPQRGPSARYRVETPTAVIGVRGTEFRAGYDLEAREARAEVVGGSVGLSPVGGRAHEHRLSQGFGFVAGEGSASGVVKLLPAPDTATLPPVFDRPLVRMPLPTLEGAVGWRMQVVREGTARPVLFDERVMDGPARIRDLPDGEYRLLVRGIDANGLEGFDASHVFTLKARPEPPFTSMPASGGKAAAGAVELSWTHAPEGRRYAVEVATLAGGDVAEAFAEPLFRDETRGVSADVTLEPGEHVWRVATIRADGERGPWSDPVPFTVRPLQALSEPPAVGKNEMLFRWVGEEGQRFEYQFAADEAFSEIRTEGATDVPELMLKRPSGGTYYLRIRAIDADGYVNAWGGAQRVEVPGQWWWMLLPLLAL